MAARRSFELIKKQRKYGPNGIDFIINFALVSTMIISGALGRILGDDNFVNVVSFLAFLPTGPYQLVSALIGSLNGNKDKKSYLLVALLYLGGCYVYSTYFMDSAGEQLQAKMRLPIYAFPIIGSICYTYLTFLAYEKELANSTQTSY